MKFELTGMLRAEMVFKEPVGDVPGISGGRCAGDQRRAGKSGGGGKGR